MVASIFFTQKARFFDSHFYRCHLRILGLFFAKKELNYHVFL